MIADLSGRRILVVEDEYMIAADLKRALSEAQATVVGPVSDATSALRLMAEEAVDAAVLDVNLSGTSSFSVADALMQMDVPHMFLTGYDGWSIPERYRETPRMAKPFAMAAVVAMIGTLSEPGGRL